VHTHTRTHTHTHTHPCALLIKSGAAGWCCCCDMYLKRQPASLLSANRSFSTLPLSSLCPRDANYHTHTHTHIHTHTHTHTHMHTHTHTHTHTNILAHHTQHNSISSFICLIYIPHQ